MKDFPSGKGDVCHAVHGSNILTYLIHYLQSYFKMPAQEVSTQ